MALLTPVGRQWCAELRCSAVATLFGTGQYREHQEVLDAIMEAVTKQHRMELVYAAPRCEPAVRVVEPYTTWYAAGRVYLVAWCTKAGAFRTFAVQRIQRAVVLEEPFDPDPDFDPSSFVGQSFGVFQGVVHHVEIDFAPKMAHLAREYCFHASQRIQEREDGGVRFTMDASGLPEIAAWVAGFGGMARPLEPPELVEAVRELHEGGLAAIRALTSDDNNKE
jgi:predicted DNA-binding transcriptional regulator YafY